jgi:molybdenum cofactor guanylyltransferase
MLGAGASRVLWLRVRHASLEEGVRALMDLVPAGAPIVCESNSAREVVTPGCFVIIREKGSGAIKESCKRVMARADRHITFDGTGWDAQPADLVFDCGQWWWLMDAAAIVLAGGRSRRMGRDKSLLPFGAKPMLHHIADQLRPHFRFLLIGANDAERYGVPGATVVPDRTPEQGPLMGLSSCLEATAADRVFLTGCDIPTMDMPTIRSMVAGLDNHDAVIAATDDGMRHPLFAAYRRSVLPAAQTALAEGRRRMEDMLERIRVQTFPIHDGEWFRNLNTPEEYAAACAAAARSQEQQGQS